ncbi:hypothetical protein TNCT_514821 [Trichonephila clavata]|uniref:Uncharacterized protein n=1 Tax=Trichonephila clavata TaxID=2740835 RepID=A0A8X6FMA2_TRICU|nr:hypothetical protein TNCT_514821 [Trichonephila clavata]
MIYPNTSVSKLPINLSPKLLRILVYRITQEKNLHASKLHLAEAMSGGKEYTTQVPIYSMQPLGHQNALENVANSQLAVIQCAPYRPEPSSAYLPSVALVRLSVKRR